ncbi:hypothetical protein Leryth_019892 [Lithospermum erythrorhizon]|nr:hypothetical protein Leryth_019892 [Lithospermum erythrorhizon]
MKCTREGLSVEEGANRLQSLANRIGQVLRDGRWSEQEASILVPGDIVSIKLGDIIPADCRLLEGDPLKVDQSAEKSLHTKILMMKFLGFTCLNKGEIEAVVIATGVHTFFGKAWMELTTYNSLDGNCPYCYTYDDVVSHNGCWVTRLSQQGPSPKRMTAIEK